MRRPFLNLGLVLLVLAFFGYHIYPPGERLRLGKDLSGGTSLIYQVQIDQATDADAVLSRTIEVLKDRLDPQGVKDITIVPQGRDRIEISFPLPNERVKELRRRYEDRLAELERQIIEPGEIALAMNLEGDARAQALGELAAGNEQRLQLLREAARHLDQAGQAEGEYDQRQQALDEARAELEAARNAQPPDQPAIDALAERVEALESEVETLAARVAEAEIAYETARDAVLQTSLEPEEVREALQRSDQALRKRDARADTWIEIPSPRQQALDGLREEYPTLADQIDQIVEAHDAYTAEATGFDDPADVIRLLRGAGVLEFRIAVEQHPDEERLRRELQEKGPRASRAPDARWYKIRRIENWYDSVQDLRALTENPRAYFANMGGMSFIVEEYEGEYYMLLYDSPGNRMTAAEGRWSVAQASESTDQLGRPAINFLMDAPGARLLGQLSAPHVGDPLAVLLDDQVVTAPNINETISRSIQISGDFSQDEIDYIIRVLSAGSLAAKLSPEPLSVNTLGPSLGKDNLISGLTAGIWAFAIVGVFMIIYYYFFGFVAVIALACNAVLILGAMSLSAQAFTLPGIAGIVLTFGIAVDANVLIYERIREEIRKGADIRAALRLGYQRALSAIVDGNVTNLIVTVVLYNFGTTEIKGFALTLGIGVVTTLFSALVITRLIYIIFIEHVGWRKVSMLALTLPVIDRILEPAVDWLRARWVFVFISSIYVGLGLFMIFYQGAEMLDIEFRRGTQVTLPFRDDQGQPLIRARQDVKDRINTIADAADTDSQLALLRTADVVPVNALPDGVRSDTFKIKTLATDQAAVVEAITTEFADWIESLPPLNFERDDADDFRDAPVYPITSSDLGDVLGRTTVRGNVADFQGGVAILIENITPPDSIDRIEERLSLMRNQPDYSGTISRQVDLRVLDGTPDAVTSAVLLVNDQTVSWFQDEGSWQEEVASVEWNLVRDALGRAQTPAQVQSFSPAIAETFRTQAVISIFMSFLLILIYVWVRFGSIRYSVAAIVPLVHDVLTVLGLIALAEILFTFPGTEPVARALGLLPFKIDLALVAAMLTIVGYSLNDSIIVMDRIRENRGKLDYASRKVINTSVNQVISRTVVTSGTTLLAVLILYIFGGEGIRGFAFAMLMGVLIGTYSSIAVAAPIVWSRKRDHSKVDDEAPPPGGTAAQEPAVAVT